MRGCISFPFADGLVQELVDAVAPSRKINASEKLGVERLCAVRIVASAVPSDDCCTITVAFLYMRPPSRRDPEDSDPPLVSLSLPDSYDIYIDTEGEWYFSDNAVRRNRCLLKLAVVLYHYDREGRRVLG